jgi:hypothetical protein
VAQVAGLDMGSSRCGQRRSGPHAVQVITQIAIPGTTRKIPRIAEHQRQGRVGPDVGTAGGATVLLELLVGPIQPVGAIEPERDERQYPNTPRVADLDGRAVDILFVRLVPEERRVGQRAASVKLSLCQAG